jgi:hypothetical protein
MIPHNITVNMTPVSLFHVVFTSTIEGVIIITILRLGIAYLAKY